MRLSRLPLSECDWSPFPYEFLGRHVNRSARIGAASQRAPASPGSLQAFGLTHIDLKRPDASPWQPLSGYRFWPFAAGMIHIKSVASNVGANVTPLCLLRRWQRRPACQDLAPLRDRTARVDAADSDLCWAGASATHRLRPVVAQRHELAQRSPVARP